MREDEREGNKSFSAGLMPLCLRPSHLEEKDICYGKTSSSASSDNADSLEPQSVVCRECGERMWVAYLTERTVTTLQGICRLILKIRRCHNHTCARYHCVYRPEEEEGGWALPHGEFGLDVIALVGSLRYTSHRSVPEIHQALCDRGVSIAERTVTHLLQRYEELVTLHLADQQRLRERFKEQGQVILVLSTYVLSLMSFPPQTNFFGQFHQGMG